MEEEEVVAFVDDVAVSLIASITLDHTARSLVSLSGMLGRLRKSDR